MDFHSKLKCETLNKYPKISKNELFGAFDKLEDSFQNYSIYKSGFGQMISELYRDNLLRYGESLLKEGCYEVYKLARRQTVIPTENSEIRRLVEECLQLDNIMLSFYWSSFDDYEKYDALVSMMIESIGRLIPPALEEFSKKHLRGEIKRPRKSNQTKLHYSRDRLICYLILCLNEYLDIKPTAGADKINTTDTGCSLVAEWNTCKRESPTSYKGVEKIWTRRDVKRFQDSNGDVFIMDRVKRALIQLRETSE